MAVRLALACALVLTACSTRPAATPRSPEPATPPLRLLAAHGGAEVAPGKIADVLAAATVICIGEAHDEPAHHLAQQTLTRLARPDALGLEMVQKPFQGVLDDYARGTIDREAFLARVAWKERWGYDFAYYEPSIKAVLASGGTVLALNAPRELTHKVAEGGLEALSPEEKASLPQLVLDDPVHRAWFDKATEGHAGMGDAAERFYTAQVIWDETMADSAATWLQAGKGRRLVILAGTGHCMDAAIPARLRRRGIEHVISIRPVIDQDSNVADALVAPEGDYLAVVAP